MNYLWKIFGIGGYENFIEAIVNGNINDVKTYFKKSYIDKRNIKGLRPIQLACMACNVEVIRFLIENDCDTKTYEKDEPPFHEAYKNGNIEIVKYLLKNKYGMESCDLFGMRPIHWACLKGFKNVIKLLIGYGCQLDCQTYAGLTPLEIAIQYKNEECINIMKAAIEIVPLISENSQLELKAIIETYERNMQNDKKICSICIDREINCVLNCGHPFCMVCGQQFTYCPNCRARPTLPKRLYLD